MRSIRNIFSVGIICVFTVMCLYLYRSLDNRTIASDASRQEQRISSLKSDIERLRGVLKDNHNEIATLKQQIADFERKRKQEWDKQVEKENEVYDEKAQAEKALEEKVDQIAGDANHKAVEEEQKGVIPEPNRGNKVAAVFDALHKSATESSLSSCQLRGNYSNSHADVQMLDLYDVLSFDNPDGGKWKQGWDVTYDKEKVAEAKTLQVIVVPHSHCDPGWIKTFEEYYDSQTRNILDGMVKHLGENQKDMRFIYAEISFLELWWRDQEDDVRNKVIKLLKDGQLEIVTGGWVMTDEANAHYFSIITELFEGHEWIRNHIGRDFTPTSHWSIDPFGLSPSIPHLLSAANITNAAIQRVHYSVKKHLAKNRELEFMWRQLWGSHGHADIRTHVFPFYSYDVPHTCGPDPAVCCQFDFRRLNDYGCPWHINPQAITDTNVDYRAFLIYDQYRKKSQLYKTNVLLVPLGDDFRYDTELEWKVQYENYQKLFENMNNNKEWNVHARFGTLSDYFIELDRSLRVDQQSLPVLSGDFFTYADRDDHYWSGYFTSRPFYKQMDRTLSHQLRAAEIAFSLQLMNGESLPDRNVVKVFANLVEARRALSLFQHHDGVTGTAKDYVMEDYGKKMLSALRKTEKVLAETLGGLIGAVTVSSAYLALDEYRDTQDSLPQKTSYGIGQFVVVFNTLSRSRDEPVCILVDSVHAAVKSEEGKEIRQQLSPVFEIRGSQLIESGKYELCFVDQLSAFGVSVYEVIENTSNKESYAKIMARSDLAASAFDFKSITGDTFSLKNELLEATFSTANGLLKSVTPLGHKKIDVNLHYVRYGARPLKKMGTGGGDNMSGAYLFLPDGPAKALSQDAQQFVVVNGPIMKKVFVVGPQNLEILQVYSLAVNSPSVEIVNEVDIRSTSNFELAMRMDTNIESGNDLYTDLNGLQIIRRRRHLDKLPLQAHFYPMPSATYIEDASTRLSLHGNQPLGVSSLESGQLEVMLDRRLNQHDNRGLDQGVLDNHRTLSRFRLLVEPLAPSNSKNPAEERLGFHSIVGLAQSMELQYPHIRMVSSAKPSVDTASEMTSSLPCDIHVVSFRTLAGPTNYNGDRNASPKNEAAFILHRSLTDCRSKLKLKSDCDRQGNSISPKTLFPSIRSAQEASLTLLYEGKETTKVTMQPQDITSVKLSW